MATMAEQVQDERQARAVLSMIAELSGSAVRARWISSSGILPPP